MSLLGYQVTLTDGKWPVNNDDEEKEKEKDDNDNIDNDDDITLEHSHDSEFLIIKFWLTVMLFLLYVYGHTLIIFKHVILNV